MQYDTIVSANDCTATHGGSFNTNTSCNFTVHPTLECQVNNACYNSRRLMGLGDSVDALCGVNNTYYALVHELDNSYIHRHHTCYIKTVSQQTA